MPLDIARRTLEGESNSWLRTITPTSESGDRFSFLRPQSPLGIEQVLSEYLTSPFQGTAELETANKQNFGIHLKATHVFTSANKFYR